ncbi:MAG: ABC transporter substrate-binding protein [Nostoc sp. DedVER02]|uniref:ABC transporter substrate-binding protein n=1 Tax=unclassified Nostoc TaxID=2593658 RepID=UPI002AD2FB16|nr:MULTISPECIES: ABC transporter substrate-binding protein [unclassified Nostoc]MDZ7986350.1 ABC transporter substrate-binding protein [Nostoc sp. DedVER02]MDZ8112740.1 ABC transporter substrate-binding protein [Nostoc sp. DedVER01b]
MLNVLKYVAFFIITTYILFACHAWTPTNLKRPPLKVIFGSFIGECPGIIAQEKGFFKAQGIDVKPLDMKQINKKYIKLEQANFNAGKYDGISLSLGTFIMLSATNPDIQSVVIIDESTGADVVVSQSQIKTVADLKGKNLGANLGGFSEVFVTEMLKTANLTSDDVNLVKLEASEIPQRLKNNVIQAGHTWQPHLSEAMKLGGNILFTSKQTPGLILDMIVFRGDIIRDRPEDIRAFVRGWLQAANYWKENVQEGNAIISKVLKISRNTISLEGVNLTDLGENQKLFESSNPNSIYKTAKIYADFFIRSGNVSRIPELKSLFNSSFLNLAP